MPPTTPVSAPAGYVPQKAIAFGLPGAAAAAVDVTNTLPTMATLIAAGSAPLAGTAAASTVAGPFAPQLGRAI
jgi:hypothetical protein